MEKELAKKILGYPGAMISGSKSGYRNAHPDNFVIFNANVCSDIEKIWYGDLDITRSKDTLSRLSNEINAPIYVLYEMDARFDNENSPKLNRAVIKFLPDGSYEIKNELKQYYRL